MLLQQAANLNQQGANMLAVGDYQGAYRIFAQAATILRDMVVVEDHQGQGLSWPGISAFVGCRLTTLESSDFFIFNQDFQFRLVQQDLSLPFLTTACQKRFCVAIVLFNMALGRHGQAKKFGKDKFLEKALSLYSMSMEILQQVQGRSECIDVLAIAALNNMAEACYELGDISTARKLLESIKPLAASLSEATAALNRVDECYMNSLVTNLVTTARCA